MKSLGYKVMGHQKSAICPVKIGDANLTKEIANEMLSQKVYVIGFSFPVVPVGTARIRFQMSAGHTKEDVLKCVSVFDAIAKKKGFK